MGRMTNLEAIKGMNAEQLAALLYTGRTNLQGWAYPELIDWLNAPDNTRFRKEGGKEMSNEMIIICVAAFVFGVIMGLCLGKANK